MFDGSLQQLVIQLHVFSTFFMTGIIWYVQVVHYPLFKFIKQEDGSRSAFFHLRRTAFVVMPVMIIELITAVMLMSSSWMLLYSNYLWVNLALLILIWIISFSIHFPQHKALTKSFSSATLRPLVRSNWIRTALWTIRSLLLLRFLS